MAKKYICPGCGKKVKFGTHFCSGDQAFTTAVESRLDDPEPAYRDRKSFRLLKRIGIVLVAALLVLLLLAGTIGIYASLALVGIAVIVAVAIMLISDGIAGPSGSRSVDYRNLVKLLHGDKEAAERLIDSESKKYPGYSRKECVRRVYDRLIYDRSR